MLDMLQCIRLNVIIHYRLNRMYYGRWPKYAAYSLRTYSNIRHRVILLHTPDCRLLSSLEYVSLQDDNVPVYNPMRFAMFSGIVQFNFIHIIP